jgi:menaquinone-dependent protoporphyrinogen oxidase
MDKMVGTILVAYASRYGSTKEISEEIAATLSEEGMDVEVKNVIDITDLTGYKGVVIGSPIYMGKWLPEAVDFLQVHQEQLRMMPVAVFAVGFSMKDPSDENRQRAKASLAAIRPYVHPFDVGIFAGKLVINDLSDADRDIIRMAQGEEGDFRNWDEITAWASGLEWLFQPV